MGIWGFQLGIDWDFKVLVGEIRVSGAGDLGGGLEVWFRSSFGRDGELGVRFWIRNRVRSEVGD